MKNTWINEYPQFKPDYTPVEMARVGIFKGAYFNVPQLSIGNADLEIEFLNSFSAKVFEDLLYSNPNVRKNLYGVDCGMSYEEWLDRGWINDIDPYGWYNWYINFYYGRRCSDDSRQIGRWCSFVARHGGMLKYQCSIKNRPITDTSIGLKTRQNLSSITI